MSMYMLKFWINWMLIISTSAAATQPKRSYTIHNKTYKFSISLPAGMKEVNEPSLQDTKYYIDTNAGILLVVSARQTRFRSVGEYVNCSTEQLEQQLRTYGDTSLTLISCRRSTYYPKKTSVLHFKTSSIPDDYDTYIIYFIHHRHRDIQISFTYSSANEKKCMEYINAVMQTVKLKKTI